jgi:hypothetical protein
VLQVDPSSREVLPCVCVCVCVCVGLIVFDLQISTIRRPMPSPAVVPHENTV